MRVHGFDYRLNDFRIGELRNAMTQIEYVAIPASIRAPGAAKGIEHLDRFR